MNMKSGKENMAMLKITLTSGLVGKPKTQRRIIKALGLRKYGHTVIHAESATIRGMCNKANHLISVTKVEKESGH